MYSTWLLFFLRALYTWCLEGSHRGTDHTHLGFQMGRMETWLRTGKTRPLGGGERGGITQNVWLKMAFNCSISYACIYVYVCMYAHISTYTHT